MKTLPRSIFRQALLLCLALLCLSALAEEVRTVAAKTVGEYTLEAKPGDRVLAVEGRIVANYEGNLYTGIRLELNGVVLDGSRIKGPIIATYSRSPWLNRLPVPRYSAVDRCFTFNSDVDYEEGNGPFWKDSEAHFYTQGCPPLLQLAVGDLLHPGQNTLRIINDVTLPFEMRRLELVKDAEPQDVEMLPEPNWPLFFHQPEMAKRYRAALGKPLFASPQRANLLAGLGLADYYRSEELSKDVAEDWQRALAMDNDFPLRNEIACRLAAQHVERGSWPGGKKTAGLVREAIAGDDSWSELARTLLGLRGEKITGSTRLILCPTVSDGPIKVDGALDDPCWTSALRYPLTCPMVQVGNESDLPLYDTLFYLTVLPDGLAVAYVGQLPAANSWKSGIRRDGAVWEDNCVELFVTPNLDFITYYELNATPIGGQYDGRNKWSRRGDAGWNGRWLVAARLQGRSFTVEYFVPWTDLGFDHKPGKGTLLLINTMRYAVEDRNGQRLGKFFTLTPHRAYDCHRPQDGAVLIV
ncbi:MAG TPA: carbohydrate-binding family 9-like protein, partial [Armatimonadota bacterium]